MLYNQGSAPRDPDAGLVAVFKNYAQRNVAKSAQAGRPIFDDIEIVEIRFPGSQAMSAFPATAITDWINDPYSGAVTPRTYAERFARQYQQFKAQVQQTKEGTPLDYVAFLTEGRRAELRALNLYTVEALAQLDGQELKNIGQGGRELKNQATEYLENAKRIAPSTQLQAELEAMRARNQVLEDDNKALAARAKLETSGDDMLDAMTDTQLKDYIGTQTGARPQGAPARKTLLRMALDARPKVAA